MISDPMLNRVLYVDLSKKTFHVKERQDLFQTYLGGTGVATALLKEECPEDIRPFNIKNPIIFAVGPLTGLYPLASKTVAMFKSPVTDNIGESHCGGRSAVSIRMAGYGAIVIKGISDIPVYLAIHGDRVYFRDATSLWGMNSCFTPARIIRQKESGAGFRTIMRIGRAGEKLVSYANVMVETYRHFGRLGLGAIFGSKNLKAILISGKRSIPVTNGKLYRRCYDDIFKSVIHSPAMKKYYELGTSANISSLNREKGLPFRNLKTAHDPNAAHISGESFAEKHLGRRIACAHCPVACIHLATMRIPYEDERYFVRTKMVSYDYELIYALGTMLGITDQARCLLLMDTVESAGLDAMSTGVVLAWATEMFENGEIDLFETDGTAFQWGDHNAYIEAVEKIVSQKNDFYKALARGVIHASKQYGGTEYALAYGGNEMPGYHTGPGAHLGFLMGARHSHLDNAGYSVDQNVLQKQSLTPSQLVDTLIMEEQKRQVLSSLAVCFFARGIYTPFVILDALKTVGFTCEPEDIEKLGADIYRAKFQFKLREGFKRDDLSFPKRIFDTESALGKIDPLYLEQAIDYFWKRIQE